MKFSGLHKIYDRSLSTMKESIDFFLIQTNGTIKSIQKVSHTLYEELRDHPLFSFGSGYEYSSSRKKFIKNTFFLSMGLAFLPIKSMAVQFGSENIVPEKELQEILLRMAVSMMKSDIRRYNYNFDYDNPRSKAKAPKKENEYITLDDDVAEKIIQRFPRFFFRTTSHQRIYLYKNSYFLSIIEKGYMTGQGRTYELPKDANLDDTMFLIKILDQYEGYYRTKVTMMHSDFIDEIVEKYRLFGVRGLIPEHKYNRIHNIVLELNNTSLDNKNARTYNDSIHLFASYLESKIRDGHITLHPALLAKICKKNPEIKYDLAFPEAKNSTDALDDVFDDTYVSQFPSLIAKDVMMLLKEKELISPHLYEEKGEQDFFFRCAAFCAVYETPFLGDGLHPAFAIANTKKTHEPWYKEYYRISNEKINNYYLAKRLHLQHIKLGKPEHEDRINNTIAAIIVGESGHRSVQDLRNGKFNYTVSRWEKSDRSTGLFQSIPEMISVFTKDKDSFDEFRLDPFGQLDALYETIISFSLNNPHITDEEEFVRTIASLWAYGDKDHLYSEYADDRWELYNKVKMSN